MGLSTVAPSLLPAPPVRVRRATTASAVSLIPAAPRRNRQFLPRSTLEWIPQFRRQSDLGSREGSDPVFSSDVSDSTSNLQRSQSTTAPRLRTTLPTRMVPRGHFNRFTVSDLDRRATTRSPDRGKLLKDGMNSPSFSSQGRRTSTLSEKEFSEDWCAGVWKRLDFSSGSPTSTLGSWTLPRLALWAPHPLWMR